ncbi:MAG: DUF885 family protein [Verrucomicrobiales bacterium]|nr:DUF885 family protein [Verrucomicrobiales bacterium]
MRLTLSMAYAGAGLLLGCTLLTQAEDPATPVALQNPFPQLIHEYQEDHGNLQRYYRFPFSGLDQERLTQFHQNYQARIGEIPFESLSQDGRIDFLLMRNHLDYQLKLIDYRNRRLKMVIRWIGFAEEMTQLFLDRRSSTSKEASLIATDLTKLLASIKETAAPLTKSGDDQLSAVHAQRVITIVSHLKRELDAWYRFYHGYDPTFNWWNQKPYQAVATALDNYLDELKNILGDDDALVGDPIGRRALTNALWNEFIAYSPEELLDIAEKEYAWCVKEWKRAASELGFEDDWKAALNHIKTLHVSPGDQPAMIKELADEAVDFLETRDLVTIPPVCKETWRMEMMTAERQKVNPYFTGGEVISVSFPTNEMEHEDKLMSLRGNNRHFCKATVHHELIPGHHLQIYMQERHRAYRKLFRTPFLVEGWALYWEMLLWEKEFYDGPEDRVGMLFWRTHRCARIIFSLKFHLEQMTAEECVDYLVENVGHERRNATAEVRRSIQGGYEPLYQAAYMLGGLQFRALRQEFVDSGEMTEKEFHDNILLENSIPIDMIRAKFNGQEMTNGYASTWKFYSAPATEP